jgi:hypothetical protein
MTQARQEFWPFSDITVRQEDVGAPRDGLAKSEEGSKNVEPTPLFAVDSTASPVNARSLED